MFSQSNFIKLSTVLLLLVLVLGNTLTNANSPAKAAATETLPTAVLPTNEPLTAVWQTGSQPDDLMTNPIGIAVDDQGNVYVAEYVGGNHIKKFDANGKFVSDWGGSGTGEGQFNGAINDAVDSQGNVYVVDFGNTRVQKFDSTGKFLLQWATELPVGPVGIGVDKHDNVYVDNHRIHDHYLQKFDSSGKPLGQWLRTGAEDGQIGAGAQSGPESLAVDLDGNVYIADNVNNRIQKFDSNGNFLAKIGTYGTEGHGQFSSPGSVAVDGQGNVYVGDDHFIQKFDSNGKFITQWEFDAGGAAGLGAVDGQGNLYVIKTAEVTFPNSDRKASIPVLMKLSQITVPPTAATTVVPTQARTTFLAKTFKLPITFSFGPEWSINDEYPDVVNLVSKAVDVDFAFITVKNAKMVDPMNPSSQVPFPDDFATWIQSSSIFHVVGTQPVVVGGFQGIQINTNATQDCGVKRNWLFLSRTGWNCRKGEYYRFIYLDDVNGERILIMNTGGDNLSDDHFKAGVEASQKVLDTVSFRK